MSTRWGFRIGLRDHPTVQHRPWPSIFFEGSFLEETFLSRLSRGIQLEAWKVAGVARFLVRNRWSSSTALRTAHVDGHLCAGFTRLYRPMVCRYIAAGFPLALHPSVVPHKPLYFYDGRNGIVEGMEIGQDTTERWGNPNESERTVSLLSLPFPHYYYYCCRCCCTHSLDTLSNNKNSPRSLDRLEMVILTGRAGRKRGTILSRSIGYRYLDVQFQRLNTPFPWFQLGAHWSGNRD